MESLLSAHAEAGALSEDPWATAVADAGGESQTIGPYRLVRRLGVGGMGQVWLAEQAEPVLRRVALKLIRTGMYDASVIQRFQAERQSLAIMDHPVNRQGVRRRHNACGPTLPGDGVRGRPFHHRLFTGHG